MHAGIAVVSRESKGNLKKTKGYGVKYKIVQTAGEVQTS